MELETSFDDAYAKLVEHFQMNPMSNHEQVLRPLSIRLGLLKSDFRQGLVKFYNKNPFEALDLFKSNNKFSSVMLDILKEPQSFCLREKVSREPEIFKGLLQNLQAHTAEFALGLKMISVFMKRNKNYLTMNNNYTIVECLRKAWLFMADDFKVD